MTANQHRKQARQHLYTEYIKLYLLPTEDKTREVRARMRLLFAKFQQFS